MKISNAINYWLDSTSNTDKSRARKKKDFFFGNYKQLNLGFVQLPAFPSWFPCYVIVRDKALSST